MQGFRHVKAIEVRFRDLDALGHVNNATILTFVETARVEYLIDVGLIDKTVEDWLAFNYILARLECDYRQPILLGQTVSVGSKVVSLGRSSFKMAFRVEAEGELAAEGQVVLVYYDPVAKKSQPIPPDIRHKLEEFETGLSSQN